MIEIFPDHTWVKEFKNHLKLEQLVDILKERDSWFQRKSVEHYFELLVKTPSFQTKTLHFQDGKVHVGDPNEITNTDRDYIYHYLKEIAPWRKGPFSLFGIDIDSEWRSDWKWDRIKDDLDLKDKVVLDIGCNNGFYLFRMLEHNPKTLLGIDPIPKLWLQFMAFQKYLRKSNLFFEMLGAEHIDLFQEMFDVVFCMGILYHRKNPLQNLIDISQSLKPGGTLYVESQGIPGTEPMALFPEETYGKAKNVYFVPTTNCLANWLKKTGFVNIEILHEGKLTMEEQRKTEWCMSQSLEDFNSATNPNLTIEGYPAPIRILIKAIKKK